MALVQAETQARQDNETRAEGAAMSLVRAEKQETARPTRPRAASTRCYVDLTPPPQHIRTNHLGHDLVYGRKLPRGVIRCASAPPIQIIARVDGATITVDADAESTVG